MRRFSTILFIVAWLNAIAFTVHERTIGGSAGNGKEEDGKYYVGSHGRYTEVSRSAFQFSQWHEWSAVGLMAVALAVFGWDLSRQKARNNA
jgi:hypothetical protein